LLFFLKRGEKRGAEGAFSLVEAYEMGGGRKKKEGGRGKKRGSSPYKTKRHHLKGKRKARCS